VAPTLYLGARLPFVDYYYDDPDHPNRVTRAVSSQPYTAEDHALLAALAEYEAGLCPGCRIPIEQAWHAGMDGWYDDQGHVCHACSAHHGRQIAYTRPVTDRDFAAKPLRPFVFGVTTVPPDPPKTR
jgi:hypothetical protein